MLRKILTVLFVVLLAAWLGTEISKDPGYAFLAYQHWTVEMPLWLLFGFVVAILFIVFLVATILSGIMNFFIGCSRWQRNRRRKYVLKKTNQGLSLLAEGKWSAAEKILIQAASVSQQPFVNYLAAARAAQEQGSTERRDRYLDLAQKISPDSSVAVGLTQAELQLGNQQLEHALATLRQLHGVDPKHHHVMQLLVKLYRQLNDWRELSNLLPQIKKQGVFSKAEFEAFQIEVYQHMLAENSDDSDYAELNDTWNSLPRNLKKEHLLLAPYVRQLARLNYPDEAEALIRSALKSNWEPKLVYQYGLIPSENPTQQLQVAEHWLKQHGGSVLLFLTLGRLAKANQLWGQAKHYFQQCLALENNMEAHFEYAELLDQLNEKNEAIQQYRKGLQQALAI